MGVSLGRGARSDVTGFGVTLAIGSAATIWMGVVSWEWGAIPGRGWRGRPAPCRGGRWRGKAGAG